MQTSEYKASAKAKRKPSGGHEQAHRSTEPDATKAPRPSVAVILDESQINQVVKAASGIGDISLRLANVGEYLALDAEHPQLNDRGLSRSLMTGLLMYASFPEDGSSLGIKELSARIKANPSTTHRYLTTLVTVGLLERDPDTRRYRLTHRPGEQNTR